jgi:hypothetical protein
MKYNLIVEDKEHEIESLSRLICNFPVKEITDSDTGIVMRKRDKDKPNIWDNFYFEMNEDVNFNIHPYKVIELKVKDERLLLKSLHFKLHYAEIRWLRTYKKTSFYKIVFQNLEVI